MVMLGGHEGCYVCMHAAGRMCQDRTDMMLFFEQWAGVVAHAGQRGKHALEMHANMRCTSTTRIQQQLK